MPYSLQQCICVNLVASSVELRLSKKHFQKRTTNDYPKLAVDSVSTRVGDEGNTSLCSPLRLSQNPLLSLARVNCIVSQPSIRTDSENLEKKVQLFYQIKVIKNFNFW